MITDHVQFLKRLPSWLYKLGAQLYIDRSFPRHLFIETTASCQLSCAYCPREQVKSHMDFGIFKRIVDEASKYGRRSFSLHLFGEPLLYPRMFDAVRYIKKSNHRHTVLLTTNGVLLNRYIDELVQSGVDKVLWTWRREAKFQPETVNKLRQWGRFTVRFIDGITAKEGYEEWKDWKNVEGRRLHNYGGQIDLSKFFVPFINGKRYPCYHLWLAPAVAWNGKLLMCCADPHQKEIFGDINKELISECWKRIDKVRKSHLKEEYSGICKNCDVWKEYPDLFFDAQKS